MAHQSNTTQLMDYLKETDVYQNIVESIKSLNECDPKPSKPLAYIAERIGYKAIVVDEFKALTEDFNRLRDEVSLMRLELTKLKMQSVADVEDIENNNMPIDQSTMNGHEKSLGLVFGDICFENFINGTESYNVFAKAYDYSLINENTNIFSANNSDLDSLWPEKQKNKKKGSDEITSATVSSKEIIPEKPKTPAINVSHSTELSTEKNIESDDQSIIDISWDQSKTSAKDCSHSTEVEAEVSVLASQIDGSASETFNTDETSSIKFLDTDENGLTSSSKDSIQSKMLSTFSESPEVNEKSDEHNSQSITEISFDQSKTSAKDCSHSTEAEAEDKALASESDASTSEIFNTDETSNIQFLDTDENDLTSSCKDSIQSKMLSTLSEVNEKSDEQSSQSITYISFEQSKTSASDCSHSTEVEAEMYISVGETIISDYVNETTTYGFSGIQFLEVIPEEHESVENISTNISSNKTLTAVSEQSAPQNTDIHSNGEAAPELGIGEQISQNAICIPSDPSKMINGEISANKSDGKNDKIKDESNETPGVSIETQGDSIEIESVYISETTQNIEKMIRECFIQNCNEMQAAKLPTSDSEESEVKMSNTTQSDEMVTCSIYQQLPNNKVRETTGLNISDSAECFEINATIRQIQPQSEFIMEDVEISHHEIEMLDKEMKTNIESLNQNSCKSSPSSSSSRSDAKTVVECNAQNEWNKDCSNGISNHGEKVQNDIKEVKTRKFPDDDIETEFLLSISSGAQRSIRTFPSK